MLNIKPIKLLRGPHADTGTTGQGCVMNVIAYLNGEPQITDKSPCVCFVFRPFLVWLNDFLSDNDRQRMIPFIERAMGSHSDDPAVFVPRAEAAARFAKKCAAIASRTSSASSASIARLAASAEKMSRAALAASAEKMPRAASAAWAESAAKAAESAAKAAMVAANAASAAKTAKAAESAAKEAAMVAANAASAAKTAKAAKAAASAAESAVRESAFVAANSSRAASAALAELTEAAFSFLDENLPPANEQPAVVIKRAQKLVELSR